MRRDAAASLAMIDAMTSAIGSLFAGEDGAIRIRQFRRTLERIATDYAA